MSFHKIHISRRLRQPYNIPYRVSPHLGNMSRYVRCHSDHHKGIATRGLQITSEDLDQEHEYRLQLDKDTYKKDPNLKEQPFEASLGPDCCRTEDHRYISTYPFASFLDQL